VFYEMLTGKTLFSGETVTEVLAAVLRHEISLDVLPAGTPPAVRIALVRCLERDPRARLRDIGDLNFDDAVTVVTPAVATRPVPLWWRMAPWTVALAGVLAAWLIARPAQAPPPAPVRTSIDLPPGTQLPRRDRSIALSPDGTRLAIVLQDIATQRSQLYVRPLDSVTFTAIEGTQGATYPFWSPDGSSVGFFAARELKRFDFPNGPVRTITAATEGRGADWGKDDRIVFVAAMEPDFLRGSLYLVPADGRSAARRLGTHAESGYVVHSPKLLPDQSAVLVSLSHSDGTQPQTWQSVDLDTGTMTKVLEAGSEARVAEPGLVLFGADGLLLAQPFDVASRRTSGSPQAIADRVDADALRAAGNVTQAAGVLVYLQAPPLPMRQLSWYDVDGRAAAAIGAPAPYEAVWAAPDGRRAIVALDKWQLWLVDLASGRRSPFYAGPGRRAADVEWSPSGREIAFRDLTSHLMVVQPVDGGPSRTIGKIDERSAWAPTGWTPDGSSIVLNLYRGLRGMNIVVVNADGTGAPRPLVATDAQEYLGRVSPDGRWLAYLSDESGTLQAYVTSFPAPGVKVPVTTAGADNLRWSSSAELLVEDSGGQVWAIGVRPIATGLAVTGRRALFRSATLQTSGSFATGVGRFLLAPVTGPAAHEPALIVLTNWRQTLRR